MATAEVLKGERVYIPQGRWKGRTGVVVDFHINHGGAGGQQSQSYPVVELDPYRTQPARRVRVVTVKRIL